MKKKTAPYYVVTVEDLSHLGGPMGTEYTTIIGVHHFDKTDNILPFLARKYEISEGLPKKVKLGEFYDCLHVGFRVARVVLE